MLKDRLQCWTRKKKPSIIALATNTALTTVKKILSISILAGETDYDTKFTEFEKKRTDHYHDKYITIPKFNVLTVENFAARLKQTDSVKKTDFDVRLKSLNQKINSNKTKHLLVENELKKLKLFSQTK